MTEPTFGKSGVEPAAPPTQIGGPRRISVFISKGGTGKTTMSANLAVGLASRGRRVLLVDADPQGGISAYFAIPPTPGLAELLSGDSIDLVKVRENLLVLTAGGKRLWSVARELENRDAGYDHLRRAFARLSDLDYVIFDCSPSLGFLNYNVLEYTDYLLIPVSLDYLSALEAVETVNEIRTSTELDEVRILGLVPTFYDRRTRMGRVLLKMIRDHFDSLVTESIIRTNTKVNEAPSHQLSVSEYDPHSYGAADYGALLDELEERCRRLEAPKPL
ncbi:MAG: AAA family ATPase [Candidatus Coatesbacteria bacterium]|nr:AAA family ATPase [Candidatus Coatesbacteria bacterium]